MTRKSRIFSALAIAAAGALMITTTAYQSRAADGIVGGNYHIDEGAGYAGNEVASVTGLNTTSTGTFRYDAPGTDEDIEIASGDIKSLETAVKALSRQVVGLGDTAKAADMALDTGAATAIGNASTANTAAINQLKASVDALDNNTSLADLKASVDALKTTIESKNFGGAGDVIHTALGDASTAGIIHMTGADIYSAFPGTATLTAGSGASAATLSIPSQVQDYLIWSGNWSPTQLKAQDWSTFAVTTNESWDTVNKKTGFLGRLSYGGSSDGNDVYFFGPSGRLYVSGYRNSVNGSVFTLAPIL